MFGAIIDDNLDRIRSDMTGRGLSYEPLMEDLLDHVCCMIEEDMNAGSDFEASYGRAMDIVGERSLQEIQHHTLLNLDKKFQRMKKYTYYIGFGGALLSLVGALFKKLHLPGASILLVLAILSIVGVFLPMYFIMNHREQAEKKNPAYAIIGYSTIAVLLVGVLFKIMHWPGANVMIQAGFAVLMIGFIPLYVVNAFQKAGKEKTRLPYAVMLLLGISLVVLISSVRISGYAIDLYVKDVLKTEQYLVDIDERTRGMMVQFSDSAHLEKSRQVEEIHEQAVHLQDMVSHMRDLLLESVNQAGVPIEEVKKKDVRLQGWSKAKDYDYETAFMEETLKFRDMLDGMFMDPVLRSQLDDHLAFATNLWPYAFGARVIVGESFIINYHMLTKISKGIALSEYLAVEYLLAH
jgi:hypothetical protein